MNRVHRNHIDNVEKVRLQHDHHRVLLDNQHISHAFEVARRSRRPRQCRLAKQPSTKKGHGEEGGGLQPFKLLSIGIPRVQTRQETGKKRETAAQCCEAHGAD